MGTSLLYIINRQRHWLVQNKHCPLDKMAEILQRNSNIWFWKKILYILSRFKSQWFLNFFWQTASILYLMSDDDNDYARWASFCQLSQGISTTCVLAISVINLIRVDNMSCGTCGHYESLLTLNMRNWFKLTKDVFTFWIICIWFDISRWNSLWRSVAYTVNTKPADVLVTSGVKTSAGVVLSK